VLAAIGVDASGSDWVARGVASQNPEPIYPPIEAHKVPRAYLKASCDTHATLKWNCLEIAGGRISMYGKQR
jgi:hypothetical protein